jgi:hypothetical protein
MYDLFIAFSILGMLAWGSLPLLDRELKDCNKLGIAEVKFVTVKKIGFLFFYYKRNEILISYFVFINTVLLFVSNLLTLTFLGLYFVFKINLFFNISFFFVCVNSLIFLVLIFKFRMLGTHKYKYRSKPKIFRDKKKDY